MSFLRPLGPPTCVSFLHVAEDRADPGTSKGKRVIRRLSDMSFVTE